MSSKIFTFGSNLAGRHGKGAAFTARQRYGAVYGIGEGLQGRSYAIPTKDALLKPLPLTVIKRHVDKFIAFANKKPDLEFMVTPIGTGLTGYDHHAIAPMFTLAPTNCVLPYKWKDIIPELTGRKYWHC